MWSETVLHPAVVSGSPEAGFTGYKDGDDDGLGAAHIPPACLQVAAMSLVPEPA